MKNFQNTQNLKATGRELEIPGLPSFPAYKSPPTGGSIGGVLHDGSQQILPPSHDWLGEHRNRNTLPELFVSKAHVIIDKTL